MKAPWPIKIIRFFSILSAIGSPLFIWYAIWAVENIPSSEFWIGFREGVVNAAANPDTGVYGYREAGAFSFDFIVSCIASILVLIFTYKKSLNGMRIVLSIEILLAIAQGAIPFLSAILIALTFMKSVKDFLRKIDSNQASEATSTSSAGPVASS